MSEEKTPKNASGFPIYRFVISGGPCGGKTSTLPLLAEKLSARGVYVLTMPEVATLLMQTGMRPGHFSVKDFQGNILDTTVHLEEKMLRIAEQLAWDGPVAIIYDRGMMDTVAYAPAEISAALFREHNLTTENIIARYDAIFFLHSTAVDAEHTYTTGNNSARRETTAKEARASDKRTLDAWKVHPNLHLFDNSTDFTGKVARVFEQLWSVIDTPHT